MPHWRKPIKKIQNSDSTVGLPPDGFATWRDFFRDRPVYRLYTCQTCGNSAISGAHYYLPEPDGEMLFENGYGGIGRVSCDSTGPVQSRRLARMVINP